MNAMWDSWLPTQGNEGGPPLTPYTLHHFHVGWKEKCETVKLLEDTTEHLYDLKVREEKDFLSKTCTKKQKQKQPADYKRKD